MVRRRKRSKLVILFFCLGFSRRVLVGCLFSNVMGVAGRVL